MATNAHAETNYSYSTQCQHLPANPPPPPRVQYSHTAVAGVSSRCKGDDSAE